MANFVLELHCGTKSQYAEKRCCYFAMDWHCRCSLSVVRFLHRYKQDKLGNAVLLNSFVSNNGEGQKMTGYVIFGLIFTVICCVLRYLIYKEEKEKRNETHNAH